MALKHYPIVKNAWLLEEEDILLYLNLFPDHKLKLTKTGDSFLHSHHIYSDQLHIKANWRIYFKNLPYNLPNEITMEQLNYLQDCYYIHLKSIKIIKYSPKELQVSTNVFNKFMYIVHTNINNQTLTPESYHKLEHEVEEHSKLSDVVFQEFIDKSKNIYLFENYLQQKNGF